MKLAPLLVLVAACATIPEKPEGEGAPLLMSLERAGCPLGGCPSYLLELRTDGWLRYQGRKDVATVGYKNAQLSAAEVQSVKDLFAAAGFYDFEDKYRCMEKTDAPTVTLGWHLDGRHKTLVHFHGCETAPNAEKLTLLEDELDRLVGSSQWVK
jgi:hypothetical protein